MNRKDKLLAMLDFQADAMIVTHKKNQYYLSGFDFDDGYLLITRDVAYLITDFRYIEAAKQETNPEFTVVMMEDDPRPVFQELVQKHHIQTVAYEESHVTVLGLSCLQDMLGNVKMIPSDGIIECMRMRKDSSEIERIITAQRIAEQAFDHILGYITPDKTELDIALELEFYMRSHGAKATSFDTIAVSGSASSRPHGVPRPVKLEKGFLTMDFGALYKGYCSDMTRTVCLGKPTDEMIRVYATVQRAQSAALDAFALGKTGEELDAVARKVIYHAGYEGCFGHGLGHGVGMDIHEAPRLKANHNVPMDVGMVVTCEPGIYLEGKYGVRIEDMVVFTENGPQNITRSPKQLIVID
jgi:Xaa-Pro aminopeptidase